MSNQSNLIKQLSNLYLIQRGHYLIQYPEPVGYRTYTKGQIVNNKKVNSLMDWQFEKHLEGKFTVGTFGGKVMTKFLTFDVDFHDKNLAKWIAYKIVDTLNNLKVFDYHISFSGSKGYHIDIFLDNLIQISHAEKFYKYVLLKSEIMQYFDAGNKVEYRPTSDQGIKLPLGKHQLTGNYCGFCSIENGLTVLNKEDSEDYLLKIKKIETKIILDIIEINSDDIYESSTFEKTENAISPHKELPIYNPSEDYSIDRTIDLLLNGLKIQGSRHNATIDIAKYLKYTGLDESECKAQLLSWMDSQDINTYTTPIDKCYEDIDGISKWVYENDCSIKPQVKDIAITYEEIKWIIDNCPEKNQKLIVYAMLIHSKRFATMQGVFFMTFKQLTEATGLYNQAIQSQINKLRDINTIEIVDRNRKQAGTKKNKPNKYRLNMNVELDESKETFIANTFNTLDLCMRFYFNDKQLKTMLPRRQYEGILAV